MDLTKLPFHHRFLLVVISAAIIITASYGVSILIGNLVTHRSLSLSFPRTLTPTPQISPGIVIIKDFAFVPNRAPVVKGETLTWINEDNVPHTVSSPTLGGQHVIPPGRSFSLDTSAIIFQSGEISYHCDFHPDMRGTIALLPSDKTQQGYRGAYEMLPANTQKCVANALGERLEGFLDGTIPLLPADEKKRFDECFVPR